MEMSAGASRMAFQGRRPRGLARRLGIEKDAIGEIGIPATARDRRASSLGIAFITGRRNRDCMASTRSGVSWPWSCSISGARASTIVASSASSASTDNATFRARPGRARQALAHLAARRAAAMAEKIRSRPCRRPQRARHRALRGCDKPQILTSRPTFEPSGISTSAGGVCLAANMTGDGCLAPK